MSRRQLVLFVFSMVLLGCVLVAMIGDTPPRQPVPSTTTPVTTMTVAPPVRFAP